VDWEGAAGARKPVELYLHNMGPGKYITDTNNARLTGEAAPAPALIGYVLPKEVCPNNNYCGKPLKLYQKGDQYITTTSTTLPVTFSDVLNQGRLLGYVIKLTK
jgi:hypothetical protein